MPNNKEIFEQKMDALANSINTKAGTTGAKTIQDLKITVDNIVIGVVPTGNQDIETLNEYDVTNKATARISATERAKCIPENIADGVTLLGVTGTHQGGGTQPTLFAPVVTGGANTISWANNTSNGAFAVTITADVNGTPVTSPLTITQAMDGQTLTITASATNFQDAVSQITLSYYDPFSAKTYLTFSNLSNYRYVYLVLTTASYDLSDWVYGLYRDVRIEKTISNNKYWRSGTLNPNEAFNAYYGFEGKEGVAKTNISLYICGSNEELSCGWVDSSSFTNDILGSSTGNITLRKNGQDIVNMSKTQGQNYWIGSVTPVEGDVIGFNGSINIPAN